MSLEALMSGVVVSMGNLNGLSVPCLDCTSKGMLLWPWLAAKETDGRKFQYRVVRAMYTLSLNSELFDVENRALYHYNSNLILNKLGRILNDIAVAQPREVGTNLPTKCFSAPAFDHRKSVRCRNGTTCAFNARGYCWFNHQPPSAPEINH